MKALPNLVSAALVAGIASLAAAPAGAATCAENRDFYQSLPTVIGREDQSQPFGYVFKCDTVFVRKGVTTVVHPGAMFYFAKPSLNSVLKVEGTLIIKGSKNAYVYLSGSLDSTANGKREPGQKQWGGIEVAEGGRLEMEYAGIMRAPTPITAFSPKVKVVNSFFKGSSGIILPDGNLMPLEISWQAIHNLDLEKGARDRGPGAVEDSAKGGLSKEEKTALLAKKPGFWTWKKAAGGAVVAAALVGGIVFLSGGDDGGSPSPEPTPEKDDHTDPAVEVPK